MSLCSEFIITDKDHGFFCDLDLEEPASWLCNSWIIESFFREEFGRDDNNEFFTDNYHIRVDLLVCNKWLYDLLDRIEDFVYEPASNPHTDLLNMNPVVKAFDDLLKIQQQLTLGKIVYYVASY